MYYETARPDPAHARLAQSLTHTEAWGALGMTIVCVIVVALDQKDPRILWVPVGLLMLMILSSELDKKGD